MIECIDCNVFYGDKHVLKNINFSVRKNETCAIIGRSGSGKTTLLHSIAGIKNIETGEIRVNGNPVSGLRLGTSIVLQKNNLFPWKTVEQNLLLACKGQSFMDASARTFSVAEEFEIDTLLRKYPSELSGGECQRVALARGILSQSDLLILDEPTSSLDPITKEIIQNYILKMKENHPVTILLVTHDIEEAVFLGETVLVLRSGEISARIENPHGGNPTLRRELSFYEKCISLREVLEA